MSELSFAESIVISCPADRLWAMVTDVARMGEWSPVCTGCRWDEGDGPRVGGWFTGTNVTPARTWETRSQVVVADEGREFTWEVGEGYVRWGYRLRAVSSELTGLTELTETWEVLPAGVAFFTERFGADARAQLADRQAAALAGIPVTLAALKRAAEA